MGSPKSGRSIPTQACQSRTRRVETGLTALREDGASRHTSESGKPSLRLPVTGYTGCLFITPLQSISLHRLQDVIVMNPHTGGVRKNKCTERCAIPSSK
ncbi:hypothetical protein AAFF_G00130950 [Aldrovandia affinis]|uniref:Uncharacterized protein n=1 Tax=Aldrovandia affinis TaxID=143900 RepID=A0AAD7RTF6_9TELE|nr:hypothetical protein AAFF_G00130950 [Aldrovandia affinis]